MERDRWARIEELFEAALVVAPDERPLVLRKARGPDSDLIDEVESLLQAHDSAEDFLESPPFLTSPLDCTHLSVTTPREGSWIGPYRLVALLGQGGMGSVHLAETGEPRLRRWVAVKILKRGLGGEFLLRRFENERRILAGLDHPGIAKLLDGGTTEEGLPYFVMEYVEGIPIDRYCDGNRLDTRARLELFRQVCAAVHYAHQNLIVHRDLKPGNILVTPDGDVKLLDFGIAKLLQTELGEETLQLTLPAQRLMTPHYASPEQVRGDPISTASDIYSLGVLLFELLTGHRPYRFPSSLPQDVVRVVCETEPARPSTVVTREDEVQSPDAAGTQKVTPARVAYFRDTPAHDLRRLLKGDLDNIVLHALRKEPMRRYSSAEEFSEDVRRHLEGLPVLARRDTFAYRLVKFAGRHRAGVSLALLFLVLILVGSLWIFWQARLAEQERVRAERRFEEMRGLVHTMLFEVEEAVRPLAGAEPVRRRMVDRALEYLEKLGAAERQDVEFQLELADAHLRVGDLQMELLESGAASVPDVAVSYARAMEILGKVARTKQERVGRTGPPTDPDGGHDFAASLFPADLEGEGGPDIAGEDPRGGEALVALRERLRLAIERLGTTWKEMTPAETERALKEALGHLRQAGWILGLEAPRPDGDEGQFR